MHFWLSHIRNLESFVAEPERLLDVWEAGGADGLVLGPLLFDCAEPMAHSRGLRKFREAGQTRAAFDPDPRYYSLLGVDAPAAYSGDEDLRKRLHSALESVIDRDWQLWLFDPFTGALAPSLNDNAGRICGADARRAMTARLLDTANAFPEATGVIVDGPAWGFEIAHLDVASLRDRRRIFELPDDPAACARLDYDLRELGDTQQRLEQLLHTLTPSAVRDHARDESALEDLVPGYANWLQFRMDALSDFYAELAGALSQHCDPRPGLAVCPRSPAFGRTAGYDYARVGELADVVMPKLYFWHRGYDGLVGTAWRWVTTLLRWNPGLDVSDACLVTRMFFGDTMPVVTALLDFERLVCPDYLRALAVTELQRATTAIGEAAAVVPWIDSGRAPHDGDPLPSACLEALLDAARSSGIDHFTYFNSTNMSSAEWTMLSHHCGSEWNALTAPGWFPPDQPTL